MLAFNFNDFDSLFSMFDCENVNKESKESKDYKKREHEVISKDGKFKTVSIDETWTDTNGCSHRSMSTKTIPNISAEEITKQKTINALKHDIQEAVMEEDYDLAAKKQKELKKIE